MTIEASQKAGTSIQLFHLPRRVVSDAAKAFPVEIAQ